MNQEFKKKKIFTIVLEFFMVTVKFLLNILVKNSIQLMKVIDKLKRKKKRTSKPLVKNFK